MFNESFIEVLNHEGVVSVTSWANEKVHVANTWNSYLFLTADNRILPGLTKHKKMLMCRTK